jgi:hypothetical protein
MTINYHEYLSKIMIWIANQDFKILIKIIS